MAFPDHCPGPSGGGSVPRSSWALLFPLIRSLSTPPTPRLTLTSGPKGTWSLGLKSLPAPPPRGTIPKSFRK